MKTPLDFDETDGDKSRAGDIVATLPHLAKMLEDYGSPEAARDILHARDTILRQGYRLNHFEPWPEDGSLRSRIMARVSPEGREGALQGWDTARNLVASGNRGSLPRDIIESYFDSDCDLLTEAAAELVLLTTRNQELEAALQKIADEPMMLSEIQALARSTLTRSR